MGEHHHDDHVDDGRETEREGEATHAAHREHVQDHGGKQVDRVGGEDGAACAAPSVLDRGIEAAALAELVANAFEVHDERVRRHTDRHDQTRDTREREAVVDEPRQQRNEHIRERTRDDERAHGHEAERAVLDERVDHHEHEADRTGDETLLELVGTQGRGDLLLGLHLEGDRQRTELQLVGQLLRGLLSKGAGNRRLATRDRPGDTRGGDHHSVEHHRELVARRLEGRDALRDLGEGGSSVARELEAHLEAAGERALLAQLGARGRGIDVGAVHLDRAQDVLGESVLVTRDIGRCGVARGHARQVLGQRAVEGVVALLHLGGDPLEGRCIGGLRVGRRLRAR
ncbi:hypothetical protein GCM10025873_07220 [Demequina sediminis]|nr:hypothetical protein GCM10025873_07220 [Demequina sediminis]